MHSRRVIIEVLGLSGHAPQVVRDALHIHREQADWLVAVKQEDHLLVVKGNQPTLLDRCAGLAWHRVPVADRTRDQATAG